MTWVYLSPHFDDVALSCGGLVWEQARAGAQVSIWTICAGEPPPGEISPFAQELHARWKTDLHAPLWRKDEDVRSCLRLGAAYWHFSIPDCIYRRHPQSGAFMYASEAALNGPIHPGDSPVIHALLKDIQQSLPFDPMVVCPLALGAHVDHQLTRQAAEMLTGRLWYYADFPYVQRCKPQLQQMQLEGWTYRIFDISPEGLTAWQESISAHGSQISTFWPDEPSMQQSVREYWLENGGVRLWTRTAA